ncbi:hypothetical protein NDU88_002731 [Pleurodeles waltl]|uniref:Peptidase A2 domain-containing protein n=1 Tax=Pleurodeles waltl TaxID=8319 RepID=A0AAV7TMR5_PLEWA|nr:hypothetical protein NDU88_002731 [Pleurodeles waltl]
MCEGANVECEREENREWGREGEVTVAEGGGAFCSYCKKKGNFFAVCNQRKFKKSVHSIANDPDETQRVGDFQCGQIVLQISDCKAKGPVDYVLVEGARTLMLFDSGAKITIISNQFYQEHLEGKVQLFKPDIRPCAYGGEPIELHGYFLGLLEYAQRFATGKVLVSTESRKYENDGLEGDDTECFDQVCEVSFEVIPEAKWREETLGDVVLQEVIKLLQDNWRSKKQDCGDRAMRPFHSNPEPCQKQANCY